MIPVLTFHSIGIENSSWTQRYLSSPLKHFETFCKYLINHKYETMFLDEWYELHDNNNEIDKNKIVLTFDDGYLDNWVYVFPIIKKYGIKITIFVNPEFVDPSSEVRPTLEDIWKNRYGFTDLQPVGFLNWNEMRSMEESGFVDIQSHSMTHNTYFKSDKVIDLFNRSVNYDWLPWLFYTEKKPYYMNESMLDAIPVGFPIFEYDRSLGIKRYIPSQDFVEYSLSEFNKYPTKKKQVISDLNRITNGKSDTGRYESDNEQNSRYEYELLNSKQIIGEKLNKQIKYLCWPGGRYNDISLRKSVEAGYHASTTTRKSEKHSVYSRSDYKRISRIGMSSSMNTSRNMFYKKTNYGLVYCFREKLGNTWEKAYLRNRRRIYQMINL